MGIGFLMGGKLRWLSEARFFRTDSGFHPGSEDKHPGRAHPPQSKIEIWDLKA
jgi:hypothetical protein